MRISFSPFAALPGADCRLTVSRHGEVLTINGDTVDLSESGGAKVGHGSGGMIQPRAE